MNLDKTIDMMTALGVGFLLLGYLVIPQFVNAVAAIANITDDAVKSFMGAGLGIVAFLGLIYWIKSARGKE